MKTHRRTPLCTVLVLATCYAFGSALADNGNELLIPIEKDELAQVQIENDWFLKDYLYFSKRHRIVRINEAALRSTDPITISLFPDAKVTAQREQIRETPGTTLRWVGKVVDTNSNDFGLVLETDSQKEMIGLLTELKIGGVFYDVDIATNESFVPNTDWSIKGYSRPADPSRIEKAAYLAISAFILSPALEGVYKIQSLNATPEYHLVFEFDSTREYVEGELADPVLNAENTVRRERHRAHKEAIGESPGVTWSQNVRAAAAESAERGEKK